MGRIKVEIVPRGKLPPPTKSKFLVPEDMLFALFVARLRNLNHIELKSSQALFYYIDNTLPVMTRTMGELKDMHGNPDVLRVEYEMENVFG